MWNYLLDRAAVNPFYFGVLCAICGVAVFCGIGAVAAVVYCVVALALRLVGVL